MATLRSDTRLHNSLADILRLLERHRVLDSLAQQEGRRRDMLENLQHRQNLAELNRRLRTMHAADIAYVLEAMPPGDRQTIWEQVSLEHAGDVFVELSSAVRAVAGGEHAARDPARDARTPRPGRPELRLAVAARGRARRGHAGAAVGRPLGVRASHPVSCGHRRPPHEPGADRGRRTRAPSATRWRCCGAEATCRRRPMSSSSSTGDGSSAAPCRCKRS